jgi:hypothetical protein
MDPSVRPAGDPRAAYRKRKKLVELSSIPFFVLAAVALLSKMTSGRFLGIPFATAGPLAYVTFLATFIFHILIWRCPACKRFLGLAGPIKFCPQCGTRIGGGPGEDARTGGR